MIMMVVPSKIIRLYLDFMNYIGQPGLTERAMKPEEEGEG